VSDGGVAAGTRAAQALKPVLSALRISMLDELVRTTDALRLLRAGS
jgi:hypothetical protein